MTPRTSMGGLRRSQSPIEVNKAKLQYRICVFCRLHYCIYFRYCPFCLQIRWVRMANHIFVSSILHYCIFGIIYVSPHLRRATLANRLNLQVQAQVRLWVRFQQVLFQVCMETLDSRVNKPILSINPPNDTRELEGMWVVGVGYCGGNERIVPLVGDSCWQLNTWKLKNDKRLI